MNIKHIVPHSTEAQYHCFMHKEDPTGIDQARAVGLLNKFTDANLIELSAWRGDVEQTLINIKMGLTQHGLIPHRYLNSIAIHFGYHWNGRAYD